MICHNVLVLLVQSGEPVCVGHLALPHPSSAGELVEVVAGVDAAVQGGEDGGGGDDAVLA